MNGDIYVICGLVTACVGGLILVGIICEIRDRRVGK